MREKLSWDAPDIEDRFIYSTSFLDNVGIGGKTLDELTPEEVECGLWFIKEVFLDSGQYYMRKDPYGYIVTYHDLNTGWPSIDAGLYKFEVPRIMRLLMSTSGVRDIAVVHFSDSQKLNLF